MYYGEEHEHVTGERVIIRGFVSGAETSQHRGSTVTVQLCQIVTVVLHIKTKTKNNLINRSRLFYGSG